MGPNTSTSPDDDGAAAAGLLREMPQGSLEASPPDESLKARDEATNELQSLRRILAADLGNIKAPAVSRTKREILEETIDRIEVVLKLIAQTKAAQGEPKEMRTE